MVPPSELGRQEGCFKAEKAAAFAFSILSHGGRASAVTQAAGEADGETAWQRAVG